MTENKEGQALTVRQQTVADLIEENKGALAKAYTDRIDPDRLVRLALAVLRNSPALLQCTPQSIISALMEAAALNLSFDPNMQQAYLIPYGKEARMQLDYRGVIALAGRSGDIYPPDAEVIKENDAYEYREGLEPVLNHTKLLVGDRGKTIAAYCIVTYKTGHKKFHIMELADLERVRKMSKQSNGPAWKGSPDEMHRKTVTINTLKYVDKTPEATKAIVHDQNLEFGDMDIGSGEVIDIDPVVASTEELKKAAKENAEEEKTPFDDKTKPEMIKHLQAKHGTLKVSPDNFKRFYCQKYGVESMNDMTQPNMIDLYGYMLNEPDEFKRDCEFEPDNLAGEPEEA